MVSGTSKVPFEVPNEMRDFAAKSLEQAKRAVDSFMGAAEKATTTAEQSAHTVHTGAKDVVQQSMTFASQNVSATFAMMEQLVHAKGMEDILKIQSEFMKGQMEAMQSHAKAVGSTLQSTAAATKGAATKK